MMDERFEVPAMNGLRPRPATLDDLPSTDGKFELLDRQEAHAEPAAALGG